MTNHPDHPISFSSFGYKLLDHLLREYKTDDSATNLFISPLSLALAMNLLMKGAGGATQKEIIQLLDCSAEQINDLFDYSQSLIRDLNSTSAGLQILNAVALWVNQRFPLKDDFVSWADSAYQAQVQNRDFSQPAVVGEINHWVKQATQHHIDSIIERLSPSHIAVIVNAIFFKGSWKEAFDPQRTQPAPFYLINGRPIEVPMLNQKGKYTYYHSDEFELLQLPYQGEQAACILILPNKEITSHIAKILTFHQKLAEINLFDLVLNSKKVEANIALPRLKVAYSVELSKVLQTLGMKAAFSESAADFSSMCTIPPQAYLSEVLHKTTLEMNEEGTQASAATKITMVSKSITKTRNFIVNRPYYCAIVFRNREILFHGWILNPLH